MTISKKVMRQAEFLKDVRRLLAYVEADKKYVVTGGELERTEYQQKDYVSRGLSKTMNSNHIVRSAIDLHFYNSEGKWIGADKEAKKKLQEYGDYWENLSPKNKWGGNYTSFLDVPHFERKE